MPNQGSRHRHIKEVQFLGCPFFHNAATRQIAGKRATVDVLMGVWKWPPAVTEAMTLAGVKPILEYIGRVRQDTIAQYVVTRPIMDMCNLTLKRSGNPRTRGTYWWTQQSGVYEALQAEGVLREGLD